MLGAPVIQNDGSLTGVIELYRRLAKEGENARLHEIFHEEDEEIASSYLVWGGIALHYADMYFALAKQRNLHQFLLTVVRSIFQVHLKKQNTKQYKLFIILLIELFNFLGNGEYRYVDC